MFGKHCKKNEKATDKKKILANHVSNKELRVHKEILSFNKKPNN